VKEQDMRRTLPVAVAAIAIALAAPAAAGAHVTVQPTSAPAGGFARLDVRVPNERDDKGTIKVDVQMPPGVAFASYEPVPGWTTNVTTEQLDQPIDVHGEEVTEQVSRVTWTGNPRQGGVIEPGQFRDFGLSLRVPDGEPGSKLTFKALQTYQGGEVVRWIGPEDADEPAATVTLAAAEEEHGAAGGGDEAAGEPALASAPAAAGDGDDGGSDGLAIAALVVGALGLAAGVGGLLAARRAAAT
jgi:periplasmic copper chaperone A